MAFFKSIQTPPKTRSRRHSREGTKSKVMEHTKGKRSKGPYPKSKFSRVWKRNGSYQQTSKNPRFAGHN